MVSFTELMKHADAWGCFSIPTLNHTGLLKAAFCCTSRCVSSSEKPAGRRRGEVALLLGPAADRVHHPRDQPAHAALALGEPIWPRKYFEATMFVAVWLQLVGTSMSVLLEDRLAALVVDDRRAHLPCKLVEGVSGPPS
jgi:hypothetical protein